MDMISVLLIHVESTVLKKVSQTPGKDLKLKLCSYEYYSLINKPQNVVKITTLIGYSLIKP